MKINVIIVKTNNVIVSITPYSDEEDDCIDVSMPITRENINDFVEILKTDNIAMNITPNPLKHYIKELERLESGEMYPSRILRKVFLNNVECLVGGFSIYENNIILPAKFGSIEIISDEIDVKDFTTEQLQFMYDDAESFGFYDGEEGDEFIFAGEYAILKELELRKPRI